MWLRCTRWGSYDFSLAAPQPSYGFSLAAPQPSYGFSLFVVNLQMVSPCLWSTFIWFLLSCSSTFIWFLPSCSSTFIWFLLVCGQPSYGFSLAAPQPSHGFSLFVVNLHMVSWFLSFQGNRYDQEKLLTQSNTLYVGNLSFYTTEEQVGHSIMVLRSPRVSHHRVLKKQIWPSVHFSSNRCTSCLLKVEMSNAS